MRQRHTKPSHARQPCINDKRLKDQIPALSVRFQRYLNRQRQPTCSRRLGPLQLATAQLKILDKNAAYIRLQRVARIADDCGRLHVTRADYCSQKEQANKYE
ncbi:MAG: hypothetical protein GXY58_17685 [Planctomycetaceae bacterium]|nr:hypothetical protein [Planctomycetaceae bacterium]